MEFDKFYETSGICIDTRKIEKNCLFICLKGENFNGNDFAEQALISGAKYVISDDVKYSNSENIFVVPNSLKFLQELGNYHRKKFEIPIIGITGTNGKTTSKELIAAVLSQKYNTLYTLGNLNNHIGVPLTLLKLSKEHEIAVIEMGANKPGDIKELIEITEPTHGIITNMGKAHLEGFGSFEGIQKTKSEMYDYLSKNNSTVFYNFDDEILKTNLQNQKLKLIPYSSEHTSYIKGDLISMSPFINMKWSSSEYESQLLETKMIGSYNYYNFLAAICIGKYFGIENDKINHALINYQPANNRSQIEKTENNLLILDAYNANPTSMKNAIESFNSMVSEYKLLILGDMFELGDDSIEEHKRVVEHTKDLKLNTLFVGEHFYKLRNQSDTNFFKNKEEIRLFLTKNTIKNNLILLKASRGIGLETLKDVL
jgi:UDP-N-acetylmuramoyl-tripeptide--D-alanyl-D-alanine ligase